MRSDSLQLPCVQPPTFLLKENNAAICALPKKTAWQYACALPNGHHGRGGQDGHHGRHRHHGLHGHHGHQDFHGPLGNHVHQGQLAQKDMTIKLDFPVNLCRAASTILAIF